VVSNICRLSDFLDHALLKPGDVVENLVRPAVDMDPTTVADTVLVAGDVDQISLNLRDRVMALLVGDDDQEVAIR
jgi:hypothetical protein